MIPTYGSNAPRDRETHHPRDALTRDLDQPSQMFYAGASRSREMTTIRIW
jgi:hypothetical protein